MDALKSLQDYDLPFARLLGIKIVSAAPERVAAEMLVRTDLCTSPAVLHGGAMMALADTLGACATMLNLAGAATTTTIESKTNFSRLRRWVQQLRQNASLSIVESARWYGRLGLPVRMGG